MKLVREHINFQRGLDPKAAMGSGVFYPRTFTNISEFINYIIMVLPIIFDGKIPDDILSKPETGILPSSYYRKIRIFMHNCGHQVMSNNGSIDIFREFLDYDDSIGEFLYWPELIKKELKKMGYVRDKLYDS